MTSLERMLLLLEQTHIYDTAITSPNAIELTEYSEQFENISSQLDILLDNCFVETISYEGYKIYMKLYSLPYDIDWDLMKNIVNRRLAITNRDFTIEGVKRCLLSGGLTVDLTENFEKNTVTVKILKDDEIFGSNGEREAFIKACMPCHVGVVIT